MSYKPLLSSNFVKNPNTLILIVKPPFRCSAEKGEIVQRGENELISIVMFFDCIDEAGNNGCATSVSAKS